MMTTLVSSVNAGMDPRQTTQPVLLKANEKTAAEELKAEEQQQTDTISTPDVSAVKSMADIRMMQIHQAADAGLLRPMWLEMMDMDPDMPRMSDIIRRTGENKNKNTEQRAADESERAAKSERSSDGAERAVKSERAAEGAERAVKSEHAGKPERSSDGAERAVKSERAGKPERSSDGAEHSVKSERAADGNRRAVASSK